MGCVCPAGRRLGLRGVSGDSSVFFQVSYSTRVNEVNGLVIKSKKLVCLFVQTVRINTPHVQSLDALEGEQIDVFDADCTT